MIKKLLWKQAKEAAEKKFGNLNTVEANKWLTEQYKILVDKIGTYNKSNKKALEKFKGWKPEVVKNKVTEIPTKYKKPPASSEKAVPIFSNPVSQEALTHFQSMGKLGEKGVPSFDQIMGMNMNYTDKQIFDVLKQYGWKPRLVKKADGGMILPKPKPYNFEEKIEFLKKIKGGVGPKTYLQLMSNTLNEGVEKEAISKEERDNFLKRFTGTISEDWTSAIDDENLYMYEGDYERYPPKKFNEGGLAGMLGETQPQQVGYATDRNKIIQELYDAAGGFDGTGKSFEEFMADVLFEGDYLAKGGRVGLKNGGMTPSEKWMRNYYYDGKGGYDTWMSFQEFQMGPGVDLWNRHIGKKDGGIIGLKIGGILKAGEFVFTTIKNLYKGKKGLQASRIEKDLMKKYKVKTSDPVVNDVIDRIFLRHRQGMEKFKRTMAQNSKTIPEWIEETIEENIDAISYMSTLKDRIVEREEKLLKDIDIMKDELTILNLQSDKKDQEIEKLKLEKVKAVEKAKKEADDLMIKKITMYENKLAKYGKEKK